MSSELDGFSEAILEQLSQLGIEILNDKNIDETDGLVPKAIYEMAKQSTKELKNNKQK